MDYNRSCTSGWISETKDASGTVIKKYMAPISGSVTLSDIEMRGAARVFFHEAIHFLGLSDRYSDVANSDGTKKSVSHCGFDNDIAGAGNSLEIGQIHFDNWGRAFCHKNGVFILDSMVDRAINFGMLVPPPSTYCGDKTEAAPNPEEEECEEECED
jgi:hypothetical protein